MAIVLFIPRRNRLPDKTNCALESEKMHEKKGSKNKRVFTQFSDGIVIVPLLRERFVVNYESGYPIL